MNLTVRVDNTQLISKLRNGPRRLRYAVVNALNSTALEIQAGVRAGLRDRFTPRSEFILRQAAVISFSKVGQSPLPFVEISVGQKPRLFLSEFEEGGTREPFIGKHVALPFIGGPARPRLGSRVPKRLSFEAFAFRRTTTRHGAEVWVSPDRRYYLIAGVGVFARTARGSRMVYSFRAPFKLDPKLRFIKTAQRITNRVFRARMERETANAIIRGIS